MRKVQKMKTLKDSLTTPNSGLFSAFVNPVWAESFPDSAELDIYFYTRYGDRIGNKLIKFYENDSGIVTGDDLDALAKMVYDINARKWEHLFAAYESEYNPIENTDFIETFTEHTDAEGNVDTTTSGSTTYGSHTQNDTWGLGSSSAVPESKVTNGGSDSNSGTSGTDTDSTVDHTSERRKHGNIGVTEATAMLEHEVAFWKWSFIDSVCKDICDIIALSIY